VDQKGVLEVSPSFVLFSLHPVYIPSTYTIALAYTYACKYAYI
jgi:hypothetical protein